MITVILIEPETAGNIGAIARAMRNFGLKELILVNPQADHLSEEARNRAKHSQEILQDAKIKNFEELGMDYLAATTAKLGTDYNILRSPMTPEQFCSNLQTTDPKTKIGLLIGREGKGLSNEEIAKCDFVITIPSAEEYPTLNVSHAATILFYEIFKNSKKNIRMKRYNPATAKDKEVIMGYFDNVLDKVKFSTLEKKETQKTVWKRIIGKSFLTKREAFAVIGFLKKLL